MNKFLIYPALAVCLLASCKKSEKKKLMGEWLQTEWATDSNSNKVMDASEVRQIPRMPMLNTFYTFKSGDELEVLFGDYIIKGEWKLKNDGDVLVTILDNRETRYKLMWLDDRKVQLETEGYGGMLYWQTLTKE